ncbi:hypothetical protein Tco_1145886 [Tanacetum coccineum]
MTYAMTFWQATLAILYSPIGYGCVAHDPRARIEGLDAPETLDPSSSITLTIKYKDVPNSSIKLKIFQFSIEGQHEFGSKKNPVDLRKIYATGFSNDASVADCIDNNEWKWPAQWFINHPILNQYLVYVINANMEDKLMWCSKMEVLRIFLVLKSDGIWPGYLVAVFKRLAEGLIVSCFGGVPTGDALIASPKFFLKGCLDFSFGSNYGNVANENKSFTPFFVMPPIRAPLFYGWDPLDLGWVFVGGNVAKIKGFSMVAKIIAIVILTIGEWLDEG